MSSEWPKQTIFGDKQGNCYATCIAALIGVPLEEVPNFCLKDSWLADSIEWLHERGWGVAYVYDRASRTSKLSDATAIWSSLPVILTGKSPRGDFNHCAIYHEDKLLHDPHPDDKGVLAPIQDAVLIFPLPRYEAPVDKAQGD